MPSLRLVHVLAVALGLATYATPRAQDATPAPSSVQQLEQKIQQLSQQQDELKARVRELESQSQAPPATPSLFDNLSLWGYGEIYYTHPVHDAALTQFDLYRAVFGIGYRFIDRLSFNSEYEIEHAVASSGDVGEFEVEQFYVDYQAADWITITAGLFLMPFGFLNEHHEPTNFYGVQRNFVETLIIPSTWREGGVNVHGDTEIGIGWGVGLTSGFNLAQWGFDQVYPPYLTALNLETSNVAPLQATHQELSLANAQYLSQYATLNYHGLPGFLVGAAGFTGNAVKTPTPPDSPAPGNQRVWLWEAHARWTPGKLDLSALYAGGAITNVYLANVANPGSPNPIPSAFYGVFVQAAYTVWQNSLFRVSPFVRWETYNMGSRYEGTPGPNIPSGLVPVSPTPGDYGYWPQNHDNVWTFGASFFITPHVVIKADYQLFQVNTNFTRFDIGLGVSY